MNLESDIQPPKPPINIANEMERKGWVFGAFTIGANGEREHLTRMTWNSERQRWESDGRPIDEVLKEKKAAGWLGADVCVSDKSKSGAAGPVAAHNG